MYKSVILIFLTLNVNLLAIGANVSDNYVNNKDTYSSVEPMKLAFGSYENGKFNENAVILFVFESGNIRYILTVERADGEKIPKEGGVYRFPIGKIL